MTKFEIIDKLKNEIVKEFRDSDEALAYFLNLIRKDKNRFKMNIDGS